ncbi:MAG: magnesium/cobalt transporter CorA [Rhodocyclaceae bacterium]
MPKRSDRKPRKRRVPYAPKVGRPPGSIDYVGEIKVENPTITLFDYDAEALTEVTFKSIGDSRQYKRQHDRLWLNVHGLHDPEVMREIGARFGLHPLVLEDIAHTQQRPKIDDYGDYLYVVLRAFTYDTQTHDAASDQISLVLGKGFVLSFQERPTGLFNPVRERLRKDGGMLRRAGMDALLHALIDVIVDKYFVVAEAISDDIECLEDQIMDASAAHPISAINHYKRETLQVRRAIWPTREVLNTLLRQQGTFLKEETQLYFRDIYDHTVHIIDQLDALRDQIGDLLDIHLSTVSNRLNAEVRVLTVVTTMLAPATLVTGFFGMNFQHLPFLNAPGGWEISLVFILIAGLALVALLYWLRWWTVRRR